MTQNNSSTAAAAPKFIVTSFACDDTPDYVVEKHYTTGGVTIALPTEELAQTFPIAVVYYRDGRQIDFLDAEQIALAYLNARTECAEFKEHYANIAHLLRPSR